MFELGSLRDPDEFSRRLAVTAGLFIAYRLGAHIPLSGIDPAALSQLSGTAVERISIFAIGIMPFATVIILAELVKVMVPRVRHWEQADERNRYRLNRVVIGLSLLAATIQAAGLVLAMEDARGLVTAPGTSFRLGAIATLVGGAAAVIWLADQITRHGLGSGVWLLILAPWLATLPQGLSGTEWWSPYDGFMGQNALGWAIAVVLLAAVVALIQAGGRTSETAASCLWSRLLAGTVWPWLIILIGLVLGGGSFANVDYWLAPAPPLYLLQVLVLAGLVASFAQLYVRSQRIAGVGAVSPLPPVVLAGGLAAITFADMELLRYAPSGPTFMGRSILVAAVAMAILERWWRPPFAPNPQAE